MSDSTRIVFRTQDAFEILRYTNLDLTKSGSLWMEAWATTADVETFKLNNWWFDKA